VHSRGKNASNLWLWQQARAKFNEKAWNEWIEFAVTTVHLMSAPVVCPLSTLSRSCEIFRKVWF